MKKKMDRSKKFEIFIGAPLGAILVFILKPGGLWAMIYMIVSIFIAGLIGAWTDKENNVTEPVKEK